MFIHLLCIPSLVHQTSTAVTDPAGVLRKCVIHSATKQQNSVPPDAILQLEG